MEPEEGNRAILALAMLKKHLELGQLEASPDPNQTKEMIRHGCGWPFSDCRPVRGREKGDQGQS